MNSLNSLLQNFQKLSIVSFRTNIVKYPRPIKYYGFKYYPRHENFEDPPYSPSKLFLIRRLKSMRGRNPEERKFLAFLNIDGLEKENGHVNIVKNIPQVNAMLWKVKHLVVIKPIKWKGELPQDGDFSGTYLRETGEFIISPKLKITKEEVKSSEEYITDNRKLKRSYLRKYLLEKWINAYSGSV